MPDMVKAGTNNEAGRAGANQESRMESKFEAGHTVYSEKGERAEYVTASGDGHIVRPMVESYDDESGESYDHVCDPAVWRHVFHQEPVAKFSDQLKGLHEQIAAAKGERDQLQREDYQRQRERAEKLKRFAILDNVEAFIDGKITHYVQREYSAPPCIIDVAEAVSSENSNYRKDLRLLTLGGSLVNGDLKWVLNRYSDGSGNASTVVPCTSYDQAAELVKTAVIQHFAGSRPDHEKRQDWIDSADKLGVSVPEEYRRAVVRHRILSIEQNSGYMRKQAQDYADSVAKTDAELAALRAYLEAPAGAA
jgi:hypothetical protein